jgi:hypothetical protein
MSQRRNVPRYLYGANAELFHPPASSPDEVTVISISVGGCRLQGSKIPPPGETCGLKLEWRGKEFEAVGEVAWKGKDNTAGLKFNSVPDDSLETLRELCANLRLEPPSGTPAHF